MFPVSQRPIYLSITATKPWGTFDEFDESAYDSPTGKVFPISRKFVLEFDKLKSTAIGHLHPKYGKPQQVDKNSIQRIAGSPLGVSHELIVNSGSGIETNARNAGDPEFAWCGTSDGWLRQAQKNAGGLGRGWDSGWAKTALLSNLGKAEIQFRDSLNLDGKSSAESVAQSRSPFWNIRAHSNAVVGHGGFVNFATWCGINALFLDDPTSTELFNR